jgi:glycine oxidase
MRAAIVGGGVIGSAIALALAEAGFTCRVFDAGGPGQASRAAAGMLCPDAELFDGAPEPNLFRTAKSLLLPWIDRVEDASGVSVEFQRHGLLRLLGDADQASCARGVLQRGLAQAVWLSAEDVVRLEPALPRPAHGAILFPDDGQLHVKALERALERALARAGTARADHLPVVELVSEGGRVTGVRTGEGIWESDWTVVAAGAWSQGLLTPLGVTARVSPVKGQMYAVRAPGLRLAHMVQGPGGVVLPRLDGTITVGVTHEFLGYDPYPTADGVAAIAGPAIDMVPGLRHARFVTTWAGLRPMTPDRKPVIGLVGGIEGLALAYGHYTVGILLGR